MYDFDKKKARIKKLWCAHDLIVSRIKKEIKYLQEDEDITKDFSNYLLDLSKNFNNLTTKIEKRLLNDLFEGLEDWS